MRPFLKQFIERNIDQIEDEDWDTVFHDWYNHEAAILEKDNASNLHELFFILGSVIPNIKEDSLQARKQVILEQFIHYIQYRMKKPEAATARFDSAESTLLMHLGFESVELLEIFKDAAVQCGFHRPSFHVIRLR